MDKLEMYTSTLGNMDQREEWKTFFQTRDWYDMPDNIDQNERIYRYPERESTTPKRMRRFYLLPKDVEYIYDYTPEIARSMLNDIREVLAIPVSGPVTYPDFEAYTKLDQQTIFDFLTEGGM
jgi:hypothetical protein